MLLVVISREFPLIVLKLQCNHTIIEKNYVKISQ